MGWVLIEVLMWRWAQRIFWVRLGRRLEEKRPRAPNYSLLLRRQRATHRGQALLCYSAVCTNTKLICLWSHSKRLLCCSRGNTQGQGKSYTILYCTAHHKLTRAPCTRSYSSRGATQGAWAAVHSGQWICSTNIVFNTLRWLLSVVQDTTTTCLFKKQQRRQHVASKVEYTYSILYQRYTSRGENIFHPPTKMYCRCICGGENVDHLYTKVHFK